MAKISARGDRETHRWRRRGDLLVLTEQGRLLEKTSVDTTYRVRRAAGGIGVWSREAAGAQAAIWGYEATAARR